MKSKFVCISTSLAFGAILGVFGSYEYFTPKKVPEYPKYSMNRIDSLENKVMKGGYIGLQSVKGNYV